MEYLKVYRTVLIIELKDWTKLRSDKTKDELKVYLEKVKATSWLCDIDWVIFDRYEFKKAYEEKIDWIESYISSFTKDIQEKLRERQKEKKRNVGRWFDNIEEIDKWLKMKNLVSDD